jgi:hypothetical protein
MHINGFDCHALCDLGASISIMPRKIYDMLGAIIDMKEGTIKYQFPFKKGMEHFPRRRKKLLF